MPRRKASKPPEELEDDGDAVAVIPPPVFEEGPVYADVGRMKRVVAELVARSCESLKLYEPLPRILAFHADQRDERLLRGSNRAGKTLGASVEVARALTGQDPHQKYPRENGRCFAVGFDGQHIGEVMYRKLFRAGAFKMIRDEASGDWRAYRPAADRHRASEAKPAPPLIPKRFIVEIAWEDKKKNIPRVVKLTTGWEITFYSSKGSPPQGSDIDLWWIDEEVENEAWYPELAARVLDRKGRGFWSATPQIASQQLYDLHQRSEDGDPNVGEHVALLEDNPHIDQAEKDKLWARLATDEERRVRIMGEFALSGFKVYPQFSMKVHGYDLEGEVPLDWSRYYSVDPGRQVCAVLFLAVPPPSLHMPFDALVYDELYIKQCDAATFGKRMREKRDAVIPEAALMDSHAGRVTEMGSGRTVESQYRAALKANRVKAKQTGYGFIWGADDPKAGILAVHEWLRIREDGTTALRVARGRCPNLEWEISRYHYRKINKLVSDEPEKKNDHLMDDLRYLAVYRPRWRKPKQRKEPGGYAVRALKLKRERAKKRHGSEGAFVRLGSGKN